MGQGGHREVPGHWAPCHATGPGDRHMGHQRGGGHEVGVRWGLVVRRRGAHEDAFRVGQGSGTGTMRSIQGVPIWGRMCSGTGVLGCTDRACLG